MIRSAGVAVTLVAGVVTMPAMGQSGPLLVADVRYSGMTALEHQDTFAVAPFDRSEGDDAIALSLTYINIFRNRGNGVCPVSFQPVPAALWGGLTSIDVDLDGDLDVVVVTYHREPILLVNDGNANFTLAPSGSRFPGVVPAGYRVAAADVDGDGFDDLLIGAGPGYQSLLWRNDRTGRFVDITATHLPIWNSTVADIQPGDLDGDGDVDFALAQGYGLGIPEHNAILLNQGGGRFVHQPLVSTRQTHSWVAVADFTRDGLPDLVIGNPDAACEYWINMGRGQFFDATAMVTNVRRAFDGAAGDVDGDGWPDLVISSYEGTAAHMEVHLNQAGQGFTLVPGGVAQLHPQFTVGNVELRDMDRDGDLDAVVRGAYPIQSGLPSNLAFWVLPNTTRHVLPDVTVPIGGTWRLTLWARPQDVVVPAVATRQVETSLGTLGILGLDPASLLMLPPLTMSAWSQVVTLPVPPMPRLIGTRIWTQAAVIPASQPLGPRLSNWLDTQFVR